jgi:hypothetical protein
MTPCFARSLVSRRRRRQTRRRGWGCSSSAGWCCNRVLRTRGTQGAALLRPHFVSSHTRWLDSRSDITRIRSVWTHAATSRFALISQVRARHALRTSTHEGGSARYNVSACRCSVVARARGLSWLRCLALSLETRAVRAACGADLSIQIAILVAEFELVVLDASANALTTTTSEISYAAERVTLWRWVRADSASYPLIVCTAVLDGITKAALAVFS